MNKNQLLEEMVDFQEKRVALGHLNIDLILEGIPLFTELTNKADTYELKQVSMNYVRHLKLELNKE